MTLTAQRLCHLLDYDPFSGVFCWRSRSGHNQVRAGDVAGSLNDRGYREIGIDGRVYKASRLAWCWMVGSLPPKRMEIDHIDRNPSNDAWGNLRPATHSQNMQNQGKRATNKSGFKGVAWDKKTRRYRARITLNRREIRLGYFDDPELAHRAYTRAARKYHGEFARAS